jgi:hypothetical protein
MPTAVDHLEHDLASLRALDVDNTSALTRGELLELQQAWLKVRRNADARLATLAGEVARHSAPELGAGGMARQEGFSSPNRFVAKTLGVSLGEAGRMIDVGTALVANGQGSGADAGKADSEGAPLAVPAYPHVARAVRDGELSVEMASVITRGLGRLEGRIEDSKRERLEKQLVTRAPELAVNELRRMVERSVAQADTALFEEREQRIYDERAVTVRQDNGAVIINARLDPASAAPIITVLDAMVGSAMRKRRDQDPERRDKRTAWQMRADALTWMARHALGCENSDQTLAKTTVVVSTRLKDLERGTGIAQVHGVEQPISVGALRRLAADAEVIPHVLGSESETLDLGRARRLFTPGQRLALVERDGGCAWCHAPPSYCEAHHIKWWYRDSGPTDINNGVMLCTSCHHRIHRENWGIEVIAGKVWFTPPASVDPTRRRRLGGRAAIELPHDWGEDDSGEDDRRDDDGSTEEVTREDLTRAA